jgi:hypothetical protein
MNKPFKCCGIIYSMDELAETASGYGDERKTKAKFSKPDSGFYQANKCLKK